MAVGTMATLYPDVAPNNTSSDYKIGDTVEEPSSAKADAGDPVEETTVTTTTTKRTTTTTKKPVDDFMYGDLDENGKVEITDLTYLSMYLLGDYSLAGNTLKAADVNSDGNVDLPDLAHLKQYISKDPVVLGPQK